MVANTENLLFQVSKHSLHCVPIVPYFMKCVDEQAEPPQEDVVPGTASSMCSVFTTRTAARVGTSLLKGERERKRVRVGWAGEVALQDGILTVDGRAGLWLIAIAY